METRQDTDTFQGSGTMKSFWFGHNYMIVKSLNARSPTAIDGRSRALRSVTTEKGEDASCKQHRDTLEENICWEPQAPFLIGWEP